MPGPTPIHGVLGYVPYLQGSGLSGTSPVSGFWGVWDHVFRFLRVPRESMFQRELGPALALEPLGDLDPVCGDLEGGLEPLMLKGPCL